jgi:hypothetical protein
MRKDDTFFYDYGLIYITAFTQLNVSLIGLGYYMILEFSLYTS